METANVRRGPCRANAHRLPPAIGEYIIYALCGRFGDVVGPVEQRPSSAEASHSLVTVARPLPLGAGHVYSASISHFDNSYTLILI